MVPGALGSSDSRAWAFPGRCRRRAALGCWVLHPGDPHVNPFFISIYYIPNVVPRAEDTEVNEIDLGLLSMNLESSEADRPSY